MKVIVSATGTEIDSAVDPRFGRAAYLLLVDSDKMEVTEVIDNQAARDAAHGAGINAATMVAQAGAEAVLSGRVGPKAEKVLQSAKIAIHNGAQGTVRQALGQINGTQKMTTPPPPGASGQGRGQGGQGKGCGCGGGGGQGRGRRS
ncbi:MAG: NifB/NifX family molybdenum-iron cluster-binding protein [Thermodesulfobacteriota bacterium]